MADTTEKKTYLIDVQSNLKKYAEDAAKTKEEVDKLTASTNALKKAGLDNTAEYQKETAQLQLKKQELRDLQKVVQAGIQLTNKELSYRQQLTAAIKITVQNIKDLGNGYTKNAAGIDIINPKLIREKEILAGLNLELIKHDKSLNSGGTNVGRYGEAVKAAFSSMGTSIKESIIHMTSFAAVAALAMKAIQGLKEAFFSTDEGIGVLRRWSTAAKVFAQDILKGIRGQGTSASSIKMADAAVKGLEILRIEERTEMVKVQQLETEVKLLRLRAASTKDLKEQNALYVEADKKEDQRIKIKTDHLTQELELKQVIWMQTKNATLADEIAAGHAELIAIQGEKNLRIQTKIAANKEKMAKADEVAAAKEEARLKKEFDAAQKAILDGQKALQQEVDDYKKMLEEKRQADIKWYEELDQIRQQFAERQRERELTNIENSIMIREAAWEWSFNTERARLDLQQKQELDNAEKTGAALSLINEKFANIRLQIDRAERDAKLQLYADFADNLSIIFGEQTAIGKAAAIASTTISTYAAAQKAYESVVGVPVVGPVLAVVAAAAAVAAGIANVKKILEVDTNLKGGGSLPTAISSSPPAQRATSIPVGTSLTQIQLSQPQLNTIPNMNPLTAEDITRILKGLPAPVVTVEDINRGQTNVKKISVRANI